MTEPTPALHPSSAAEVVENYCDDLLLALRMKDVPGQRIGEILTEARDHLASSGEDPVDVFGTPQNYADALTAGHSPARRSARALDTAGNATGVAGLLWTIAGAAALLMREPAELTELQLMLPIVVAVAAPLLVDAVVTARRTAVLGWGLLVAVVLAAVAITDAWFGSLIHLVVPPAVLLIPGLLVAGAWIVATARTVDPVVHPLQSAASTQRQRRRDGAFFTVLLLLLLVVPVTVTVGLQHVS